MEKNKVRKCRICGCTDDDCRQCIEKTGEPCYWVEDDLCSACKKDVKKKQDIPILLAKEVAEKTNFPCIVIYGYDKMKNLQNITTWGNSKEQCIDACDCGNWLKRQLGWDESLCHATPKRIKKERD